MTVEKKFVFVFDADDTLWPLGWLYDEACLVFWLYLIKIFSGQTPNVISVIKKHFEIDLQKSRHMGIKRGRVASTMVGLYLEICGYVNNVYGVTVYDPRHEAKIRTIGDKPFKYKRLKWLEDAKRTLSVLKQDGHKLCMLSSYDAGLFPLKNDFLNVWEFFNKSNVIQTEFKKTSDDFIRVSGWTPEIDRQFSRWIAVGNGESDILPALGISEHWHGFYIPHMTTSPYFEKVTSEFIPPPIDNPRVETLTNIKEILEYV